MLPVFPLPHRKLTEDEFYAQARLGPRSYLLSVLRAWSQSGARFRGKRAILPRVREQAPEQDPKATTDGSRFDAVI